jgi:hypothetical protein
MLGNEAANTAVLLRFQGAAKAIVKKVRAVGDESSS